MSAEGAGRRLGFALRRLGWPFHLGWLLVLAALVFELAYVQPAAERLDDAEAELIRLKAGAVTPSAGPRSGLALPAEARLPELMRAILDAAQKNGVALERGEYRQSREGGVLRLRMVLPVRGGYPQIRAWLAQVMNDQPSVAMEEISLARNAAAEGTVEGKVRLALYLEARP